MKTRYAEIAVIALGVTTTSWLALHADAQTPVPSYHRPMQEEVKATLDLRAADVQQVLGLYKDMTGIELVTDSRAKTRHSPIHVQPSAPIPKAEAAQLLEKALLEQAGIVITRLDDKKASVTYNDALPIKDQVQPRKPTESKKNL